MELSDDEAENVQNIDEFSTQIINRRLAPDTRTQYDNRIKTLKSYLQNNFPNQIVNENIKLPLKVNQIIDFLTQISKKEKKKPGDSEYKCYETVSGYNSAIKYLYDEKKFVMEERCVLEIKKFLAGYKRTCSDLKANGEMKLFEGKAPMTTVGYRYLANLALQMGSDFNLSVTVHTFLLYCWNLMARSHTICTIMYDKITWEEDSLVIYIGKMKNDQEGNNVMPRHVYANSSSPEICPILSLALFIFTRGFTREGTSQLLLGERSSDRFSEWLRTQCSNHNEEINSLGLSIDEIGTHSFRKGTL